jgi:hypothetical protein
MVGLIALMPLFTALAISGQSGLAKLSGRVVDQQGSVVARVQVQVSDPLTGLIRETVTNDSGYYTLAGVPPATYVVTAMHPGFAPIEIKDVVLNVGSEVWLPIDLMVGTIRESATVRARPSSPQQEPAISTVIDRQFVDSMPINGRSFQALIALAPGVVPTPSTSQNPGQFSVNGQRSSANYFIVDGVSANIGVSTVFGQSAAGTAAGLSVLGGTNNLVSEDALQEFRIQTSSFAPEFGRTPGAQVSLVTRSGTNQYRGAVFEYLRNDKLDAKDWFSNQHGLARSPERINDFGGVAGGPLLKDRLFFFFSFEGQRLRLPRTIVSTVPMLAARHSAPVAIRPFLDAYPIPNGPAFGNLTAQFAAGFSDQSDLNAASIRIDNKLSDKVAMFARYDHAPSDIRARASGGVSANTLTAIAAETQTLTVGLSWWPSGRVANDFRFNYSRNRTSTSFRLDSFGGATVLPDSLLFPPPFSSQDATYVFGIFSTPTYQTGDFGEALQRQFNFAGSLSVLAGAHDLKAGVDYRKLHPAFNPGVYGLTVLFPDVAAVVSGSPLFAAFTGNQGGVLSFRNLGVFIQDSWKAGQKLVLTYGLRWDLDFPPASLEGPRLAAVTTTPDLSALALAPAGTPIFRLKFGNVAPRFGFSRLLRGNAGWETVARGGFGIFYDLATAQVGTVVGSGSFSATRFQIQPKFPFNPRSIQPPPLTEAGLRQLLVAFNPALDLPRTIEWNIALEQALGENQKISVAYVAAAGRRLIQTESAIRPNAAFSQVAFITNAGSSDYHSMQIQFERRLSQRLQAVAAYTWAHSIDTASSSSLGVASADALGLSLSPESNRGPSDFDIRHTLSGALTYDVPAPSKEGLLVAALRGWEINSLVVARSAPPVNVIDGRFAALGGQPTSIRPDVVPGVPIYLADANVPGGRRINPAAFTDPPIDPRTATLIRQGTLGRNALRGFGAAQWDFALRREFQLREAWRLQFRAEVFNTLNHPNFAAPAANLAGAFFGQSTSTLAQGLAGSSPGGGFNAFFQFGGPRSVQLALKLLF